MIDGKNARDIYILKVLFFKNKNVCEYVFFFFSPLYAFMCLYSSYFYGPFQFYLHNFVSNFKKVNAHILIKNCASINTIDIQFFTITFSIITLIFCFNLKSNF